MSGYQTTIDQLLEQPTSKRRREAANLKKKYPNKRLSQIKKDLCLDEDDFETIHDAVENYKDYTDNLTKSAIQLGYRGIDETTRGIAPGEVCGLAARTAVGKTLFGINCLRNVTNNQNVPSMFFSLEQETSQVFERLAAITCNKKPISIEKCFQDEEYLRIADKLIDSYEKLVIVDRNNLSFRQLGELVVKAEDEYFQENVAFVVIDYLGYMKGYGKDSYERTSRLSREMKAFAKEHKVAVLVLQQLSREAKSGGELVRLRMCRDSGVFEESCDYLLGAWRPELSENATPEDRFHHQGLIKVAILKNRSGKHDVVELWLNSENLRIEEMKGE